MGIVNAASFSPKELCGVGFKSLPLDLEQYNVTKDYYGRDDVNTVTTAALTSNGHPKRLLVWYPLGNQATKASGGFR